MNKIRFLLFILLCSFTHLMAQRINPANPDLSPGNFRLDSLPDSELNIPIQIDLKPIYTMAEKSVDTLFTSPGYPNGWVQEACDTRYKYSFRRSKLQMKASGLSLQLGFTGYYKIVGSTRACTNGIALTPWTPPCRCGFDEPERKVNVSFSNSLALMTNYKVKLDIKRNEPQPVDKCEVCFWGQNITNQVMKGLVAELDAAKKDLDKNYGSTDLKPRMQQIWNQLNTSYNLYGLGWLKMNPRAVHLNRLEAKNDSLYVSLGLSARPIISFEQPVDSPSPVPHISNVATRPGFTIFLDAMLNYDSLSQLMSQQVAGKSFDFKKAFVKKQFIIDSCKIYGGGFDKLIIRLHFSGTNHGVIYLTGQPWYDADKRVIEIINLDFDIKTKNFLLGSAGWLFDKKITREITKFARFELGGYIDSAKVTINTQLNQEWMPGISSNGTINEIRLIRMYPMQQHLVIRSNCEGNLQVKVDAGKLSL